ncbi:outer membrane beta-barrel protein [Nonlabens sp.]|uniref:outer membrane beta-barrel protein n=1 Tax=Nonlabens sp. TaxID=1888209 RepID=UPI003F6A486D
MRNLVLFFGLLFTLTALAQDNARNVKDNAIPTVVDSLYREDQFYIGLSFNLVNNGPSGFSQNGFSGGLHLGFIRDMPINKRRNKAIGIGLGISTNSYNSNLFIGEDSDGTSIYSILDGSVVYDSNRLNTNHIEMPIQYRWRTSTASNTNFWRIYTGVKLSYIYYYRARFEQVNNTVIQTDIPELNRLRYAATLTLGNGSFNAFVHYNLNTLFNKDAQINGEAIHFQPIKFGIEFYLL